MYEVSFPYCPTCLCAIDTESGFVVYGTSCGRVGLVEFTSSGHEMHWELENPDSLGGVTALCISNLTAVQKAEGTLHHDQK